MNGIPTGLSSWYFFTLMGEESLFVARKKLLKSWNPFSRPQSHSRKWPVEFQLWSTMYRYKQGLNGNQLLVALSNYFSTRASPRALDVGEGIISTSMNSLR
jgi:hypothetical protein